MRNSINFKSAFVAAWLTIIQCMASIALAEPVLYQFSTGTNPFGASGGAISYFGAGSFVSGTFLYDSAAPSTGTSANGATNYGGYDTGGGVFSSSFASLTGTVQGLSFSDVRGRTQVGDELAAVGSTPGPVDWLALQSEPTLYTNLTGFDIGTFRLVDVRMFWLEGQLGIGDFLSNENLPTVLPTFQGRLALDFVPIGTSPTTPNFNHTVFFDGLSVSLAAPVPEPEIYAMLGVGLGLMGWLGRRRKQQAV